MTSSECWCAQTYPWLLICMTLDSTTAGVAAHASSLAMTPSRVKLLKRSEGTTTLQFHTTKETFILTVIGGHRNKAFWGQQSCLLDKREQMCVTTASLTFLSGDGVLDWRYDLYQMMVLPLRRCLWICVKTPADPGIHRVNLLPWQFSFQAWSSSFLRSSAQALSLVGTTLICTRRALREQEMSVSWCTRVHAARIMKSKQ